MYPKVMMLFALVDLRGVEDNVGAAASFISQYVILPGMQSETLLERSLLRADKVDFFSLMKNEKRSTVR